MPALSTCASRRASRRVSWPSLGGGRGPVGPLFRARRIAPPRWVPIQLWRCVRGVVLVAPARCRSYPPRRPLAPPGRASSSGRRGWTPARSSLPMPTAWSRHPRRPFHARLTTVADPPPPRCASTPASNAQRRLTAQTGDGPELALDRQVAGVAVCDLAELLGVLGRHHRPAPAPVGLGRWVCPLRALSAGTGRGDPDRDARELLGEMAAGRTRAGAPRSCPARGRPPAPALQRRRSSIGAAASEHPEYAEPLVRSSPTSTRARLRSRADRRPTARRPVFGAGLLRCARPSPRSCPGRGRPFPV